jgi:hypothetical protein
MFDLLYAGPKPAATPNPVAFDFISSPSPVPSASLSTESPPQAPPPAESTEPSSASAFDFLN